MISVELDSDVQTLLINESRRTGESLDVVANRVLVSALAPVTTKPFVVRSSPLGISETWPGLTASEILYQMDMEEYEEKLERSRHESAAVRL